LTPKPASTLWNEYPIEKFSPLNFVYYSDGKQDMLNLDANLLNLTLFKTGSTLNGWGNIGSGYFETHGAIADTQDTRLDLSANIPSIHTLMSEFGLTSPDDDLYLDARADINATVSLAEKMRIKSRVHLPWYNIQTDTQTRYQGEDVYLESTLVDNKISIDRYDLNVKGHHIYSQRPSRIAFDANGTLRFKEFWIYDNLLLSGSLNPAHMEGKLRLQSKRFNYEGKEGNVTLKADIKADFQSDGRQSIEGEITLLEGVITYEPKTDYTISNDVIIIQDIKPRSKFKRFVNIHINALKPIRYKAKDIDIRFTPDIILWQEPDTPLRIYGMVTIEDGQVLGGGKLFELDKSEIYFNGSNPINPHLNLNVRHQTLDYIDIQIYITNTLSSPVVILASNPVMSQNDIMSYILFGEPASSAFSSSGEGSKTFAVSSLLLATGLKQIFNDSAGVNIDTLNILTNEEGTLGYEIGTRFSKDIRVLYKNDTVSSVILQYSLSRSIRLDIDVHETGQGVSILYIKDF
jgi:translocation and assembly module TamB